MNNFSMPVPYAPPQIKPEVNAVKIELVNPQAYGSPDTAAFAPSMPAMYNQPAAYYAYPQTQIYPGFADPSLASPRPAPMPFLPQQPLMSIDKKEPETKLEARSSAPEPPLANFTPLQNNQKAAVPAALVEQKATTAPVSSAEPAEKKSIKTEKLPEAQEAKPAVNLKPIIGSLKSDDVDEQFNAIQTVAELGQNPKMPSDLLLNEEVFNNLKGIISKDTSQMPGPTKEQQDLRAKKFGGEKLTPEQENLALSLAPQEAAEMNKQFATFTLAIVQKNFRNSVDKEASKQGLEPVRLNEIPEMETIVENIKSNPNPLIREASIGALTYVAKPEDKETVGVILSAAAKDDDPNVQATAKKAEEKLNNLI